MILVDTHVLLDVLQNDARWGGWSERQLEAASATQGLVINPIIYSEISIAFARIEELETVLTEASLTLEEVPRDAARYRTCFPTVELIAP